MRTVRRAVAATRRSEVRGRSTVAAITAYRVTCRGRRSVMVIPSAAFAVESVSHAADGFERVPAERRVELQPEVADVDLDDVRVPVEGGIPDAIQDLHLADGVAAVPHQELEQPVLARGEHDFPAGPPPGWVEGEVAGRQHHRALRRAATDQGRRATRTRKLNSLVR